MKQHKIGWLNIPGYVPETWNPIIGCKKLSSGCEKCYAEVMARRLKGIGVEGYDKVITNGKWNSKTYLVESQLEKPFKWKKPRAIFVCSMSDLFHENTPFEWIDKVFAIFSLFPQHLFILLTKRPERALEYFTAENRLESFQDIGSEFIYENWYRLVAPKEPPIQWFWDRNYDEFGYKDFDLIYDSHEFKFDNVWLGVTCENQEQADKRIPILLQIPAEVRFVSAEPLLSSISFRWMPVFNGKIANDSGATNEFDGLRKLNWIIAGPENGPHKRQMKEEWINDIAYQCHESRTPFFDKRLILRTEFPKRLNQ